MKMYLIDTDICIEILRDNLKVIQKIRTLSNDTRICTTIVNAGELFYGVYYSTNPTLHFEEIKEFLSGIEILTLDLKSAEKYGHIKSTLRKKGKLLPDNDLFIASITLVNDLILVTHNIKHYARIDKLKIEDWVE